MKYLAEVKRRVKIGESAVVKHLPVKKRGRPLLIGVKLDMGATTITIAAGKAIVSSTDHSLLAENGGPVYNSFKELGSILLKEEAVLQQR